jgi:hypothetical protein
VVKHYRVGVGDAFADHAHELRDGRLRVYEPECPPDVVPTLESRRWR